MLRKKGNNTVDDVDDESVDNWRRTKGRKRTKKGKQLGRSEMLENSIRS